MENNMRPNKASRGILILISVFLLAGMATAQDRQTSRSNRRDNGQEPILVNVWAAADPASEQRRYSGTGSGALPSISRWGSRYASAALPSMVTMRLTRCDWRHCLHR